MAEETKPLSARPAEQHPLKVLSNNLMNMAEILAKKNADITDKDLSDLRIGLAFSGGLAKGLMYRYGTEK